MIQSNIKNHYSGSKKQVIQIQKLRKYFGDKCEYCKSTVGLQFTHKHGHDTELLGSSCGLWYRLQDVSLHPMSFLLLCRKCHRNYDRKKKEKMIAK